MAESPMVAFDSQGIALILIVAVLGLVVGGAGLWFELPCQFRRLDLKPNPVRFVPSVLAQRAVCEARNIDCRAPMIIDSPSFRSTVM